MKFNHLVEINDPSNPLIEPLTPQQLWRGLVLRAENPIGFVAGIDTFSVLERLPDGLRRELTFGTVVVRDRVTFIPPYKVHYGTEAQENLPAAELTMTIEEPGAGALFLRFEYEIKSETESSIDAFYDDFRKNAYTESDIDTVFRIRQLAEQGELNGSLN